MDIRKLQRAIVDGLEDVKAQDIQVFNTEQLSPLFERVIVASGHSNRQTKALAASVRDAVKSRGMAVLRTEGEDNGEWIIVDCGAAVAHIMQPSIRDYYRLEEIWGGKPVRVKLGDTRPGGLPKASEPANEDEAEPAPGRAQRKSAPGKAGASKPAPKRSGTAGRRKPGSQAGAAKGGASRPSAGAAPKAGGSRTTSASAGRAAQGGARSVAGKAPAAGRGVAPSRAASSKKIVVPPTSARAAGARKPAGTKPAGKAAAKTTARKTPVRRG